MSSSSPVCRPSMSAAQFMALCESIYGPQWKRPASRALGRDPKMVRLYARGAATIPADIAEHLRRIADLGHAGAVVKRVLLTATTSPDPSSGSPRARSHQQTHELAIRIIAALKREKLIAPEEEP